MKNLYILAALAISQIGTAQLPNPSFEEFTGYGNETRFWGPNPMLISITIPIDGGPSVETPTIIYEEGTSGYCFFNNEARTGTRAMELRNAYNMTDAVVVPGKMILFNENGGSVTASGWNTGFQITPEMPTVEGLGFYYKFFPVNEDVAQAKITLFNAAHESLGSAIVNLSGTHSEYTYAWSPIQLTADEQPVFMTVDFSMTDGISAPAFGSRLVIDDVTTNSVAMSAASFDSSAFLVYPTLANQEINILKGDNVQDGLRSIEIFAIDGKSVRNQNIELFGRNPSRIDVGTLSQGIYFIRLDKAVLKFVKR